MTKDKCEPTYRRGNKTRLRLNVPRKRRKHFPLKKGIKDSSYTDILPCSSGNNEHSINSIIHDENIDSNLMVTDDASSSQLPERNSAQIDNETNKKNGNGDRKMSEFVLEGRRIVNISFLMKSFSELSNHCPEMSCTLQNMQFVKEDLSGFISTLHFECNMCNRKFKIHTSDDMHDDVNQDAVLGVMAVGLGYSHLKQIAASLELPCMSSRMYDKVHNNICDKWEQTCLDSMKEAAEEEKALAVAAGDVDENQTPMITVVVDGSWAKRSYGNKHDSSSGTAAIIGYRTKKALFQGVRNKYCTICVLAERNKETPKKHQCYRNWSGSSSAMEADIIAEGFSKSLEMYGLIYNKVIADGDSNVYKKILDAHPYENLVVKKIECKNHLMRNYLKKLRELCKDTKAGPSHLRKELKDKHVRLGWAVTKAVQFRKNEDVPMTEKVSRLKMDIDNSISHVFGEHKDCQKIGYFCDKPYVPNSIISDFKVTNLYEKIISFKNQLKRHASSLIYDVNSNIVEQFNSIVAKYIGGKRINFCKKRSYQGRCAAAVVSHNTKRPIYTLKKNLACGVSPPKCTKYLELTNCKRKRSKARKRLTYGNNAHDSKSYGPNCEKPDMSEEEFSEAKKDYLNLNFKKTKEELELIEYNTRTQQDCDMWSLERRKRLTASKFGDICKMRKTTSCKVMVESIIYPKQFTALSCDYGTSNEKLAKKALSKVMGGEPIKPCGLFIDEEFQFLGASPDGLVRDHGIVEVKCPWSARDMTPEEGIEKGLIPFWKNGCIDQKHKWYFQVQGQLHITKKDYCIFAVWTQHGIKTETIVKDDKFWEEKIKNKLVRFFENCMLPELVDPRNKRNLPIKDPPYIEKAIKEKKGQDEKERIEREERKKRKLLTKKKKNIN